MSLYVFGISGSPAITGLAGPYGGRFVMYGGRFVIYGGRFVILRWKIHAIGEAKIGDLAGIYCYDVYYNKTNYEIAYTVEIHDNEIVVVIMAGTRENFYDELKKYMK